jgi:hypothetical protein
VHYFGAKTQEDVAFAVLPSSGFEEASRHGRSFGATEPAQMLLDLGGRHGALGIYRILMGSAYGSFVEPEALRRLV